MDTDTVQPVSVTEEVKAVPAPVLQLLYAHYYLSNPRPSRRPAQPDWLARLCKRAPELVDELAASGLSEGRHHFFTLAAELGYWDGSDPRDRKSTRLNSSHVAISYAVFCLKK